MTLTHNPKILTHAPTVRQLFVARILCRIWSNPYRRAAKSARYTAVCPTCSWRSPHYPHYHHAVIAELTHITTARRVHELIEQR